MVVLQNKLLKMCLPIQRLMIAVSNFDVKRQGSKVNLPPKKYGGFYPEGP